MLRHAGVLLTVSFVLLSGCATSDRCTATVTMQVQSWCEPELWQVPIEVRLGGKPVARIEPGTNSAGPFEYTTGKGGVELWIGQRMLESRPLACGPKVERTNHHELTLNGFSSELSARPAYLYFDCQGRECYERRHVARERSCFQMLYLRSDSPPGPGQLP
ncbi:MAG TPA: hypothetical protein VI653_24445 [Steroidobacteraceae bacterium]